MQQQARKDIKEHVKECQLSHEQKIQKEESRLARAHKGKGKGRGKGRGKACKKGGVSEAPCEPEIVDPELRKLRSRRAQHEDADGLVDSSSEAGPP